MAVTVWPVMEGFSTENRFGMVAYKRYFEVGDVGGD